MAVGEDEPEDVLALLDQIADVRQDQIDAGQMLFGGERDAAIDDQPLPAAARRQSRRSRGSSRSRRRRRAARKPVRLAPSVHASLPAARHCGRQPRPEKRRRPRSSRRLPSASRSSRRPRSSSPSQRPIDLAAGQPHPHDRSPMPRARGEPVGADGGKAVAAPPLREPPAASSPDSAREQILGVTSAPPAAARSVAGITYGRAVADGARN